MYTVCPGCTRQFQIYAEHLSAASGQVRCGFCHEQFNAMDRLHDEPLSNEKILNEQLAIDSASDLEIEEEPQFELPETIEPELALPKEDVFVTNNIPDNEQELETAISEIGIRPSVEETGTSSEDEAIEQNDIEASEEVTIRREIVHDEAVKEEIEPEVKQAPEEDFNFPETEDAFLLEETPAKSRWSWLLPVFWTTGTLVALVVIIAQLAWFNRDKVLLEYPELLPYAKQICKEFDCQLIRQKDVNKIKLVNRDVRLHPTYQDTLLVNAAMENELPIRQPYPRVQLTLFDTSGSLLGYREFVPDDYLDSSIEVEKGMPVDSPVYFVLEVSGPTAGAVSFEFRFL
jgi:predicted Zn finger-like uncharacterized protein